MDPYYDPQTISLAFNPFIETLKSATPHSVFLIHACAHNPTGMDPTHEKWGQIADMMLKKGHFAFFDCAYQGFASGDLDNDAWAVHEFIQRSAPCLSARYVTVRRSPPHLNAALSAKADISPLGHNPHRASQRTLGCTASESERHTSCCHRRRAPPGSRASCQCLPGWRSATHLPTGLIW